ncbi:MAG: Ig-like domain repeat protein, partial [Acidobacteriaceae bacterium]|nr:Ig-like domain repeat protein [Acidobacteriaceae bacterium]
TVLGSPVTSGSVSGGSAGATYVIPGGVGAGSYTINAVYNGSSSFSSSSDNTHFLTVGGAATNVSANSVSVTYSPNAQNVTLSATVTSAAGAVNAGTVTFTILTPVATAVTSNTVSNGTTAVTYSLPGGTAVGSYTIQAVYNGGGNFTGSYDVAHAATVTGAATSTTAGNVSISYSASTQNVTLSANVTSAAGIVNGGTVTFALFSNGAAVGSALTSSAVTNGNATAAYNLPAGTTAGAYTIQAVYNAAGNFATSSDSTHTVTVTGAATNTAGNNALTLFSPSAQTVSLFATVTSPAGSVNSGSVTFTVLNNGQAVGSPVTSATVSNGVASTNYTVPAGMAAGTYTILAAYNAGWNFVSSSDGTHILTIGGAATAMTASAPAATYASGMQNVSMSATVTSAAGTVNGGTVTFTVVNNGTPVGSPVSGIVSGGSAGANYSLPAGSNAGAYTIQAVYSGAGNFGSSSDTSHALTVNAASSTVSANSTSIASSSNAQNVSLTASVTSAAGTVNGGAVTFSVLNNGTLIGSPVVSSTVANGTASATYILPGNTSPGTYTIQAVYSGTTNFSASNDPVTLTVTSSGAVYFVPVTPCRLVDTRNANGTFGGPSIGASGWRSFPVAGNCGVPANATAYSMNVTAVPPGSQPLWYLTVFPTGTATPNDSTPSTLNSVSGQVVANAAIVPAGTGGSVSVYASGTSTDVILDVNGYFTSTPSVPLYFVPITPCRLADTRGSTGNFGGPSIQSYAAPRVFPVPSGSCGIPATAAAYAFNVTAVPQGPSPLYYLTV